MIAMEAYGAAHWPRGVRALGQEVRLIAPIYVKAFVKRDKNERLMQRRSPKLRRVQRSGLSR
jgi:transposase